MAKIPFSDETAVKMLPYLDNTDFVRELGNDLRRIFEVRHCSVLFHLIDPLFLGGCGFRQASLRQTAFCNTRPDLQPAGGFTHQEVSSSVSFGKKILF
jgi:hypothetical protein